MSSKLLHAIVGVGIAFGAGAGCGGSSTAEYAGVPADAGPDLSKFDPFCDASWPTTKGNPGPPACVDPKNECDPTKRMICTKSLGPLRCDYTRDSAFCIDKEWVCHPDTEDATACRCVGDIPPGYVCTEMGWAMLDGGAG